MIETLEKQTPPSLSPQEYLVRERAAEYKSDYVYGEIRAVAGGTLDHSTIIVNITREVSARLKGKPCRALSNETKVLADPEGLYTYPDLIVVFGEPRVLDDNTDV